MITRRDKRDESGRGRPEGKAGGHRRQHTGRGGGYPTARSAYQLARKHGVTTPVIDEAYAMLYEGKNVAQAVRDLMARDPKPE